MKIARVVDSAPKPGLIAAKDVQQLGSGNALDVFSCSAPTGERQSLVFDSSDGLASYAKLYVSQVKDGVATTPVELLGKETANFVAAPSTAAVGNQRYLYFETASDLLSKPELHRAPLTASGGLGAIENVVSPDNLKNLLAWPRVTTYWDGVALAYRSGGLANVSVSKDGTHFSEPVQIGPDSGAAMPTVAAFGERGLAYTYQTESASEPMVAWVRWSDNIGHWSTPQRVSEMSNNVHDTAMLPCPDGSVDLYFSYVEPGSGHAVHRRNLSLDGKLGPEQLVTDKTVPDAMKPSPSRLADGRVLLAFDSGTERDPVQHYVTKQRLDMAILPGDAPR